MNPSPKVEPSLDEQWPDRYRTLLIFGAPGSGKGTQGKALGSVPRFFHCACGDVFRSLDTRTKLGQAFLDYSSRGELVPAEITHRTLEGADSDATWKRTASSPTWITSCSTASRAASSRRAR